MKRVQRVSVIFSLLVFLGCGREHQQGGIEFDVEPTGKQYLCDTEPSNPVPVGQARINAKDGERVVLVGHIGGSAEPFVNGIAAFTIVDPAVEYCQPEQGCPTPWDYCCTQNEVKDNIATIKVVNEHGNPVAEDARQLLGVKELSLVVVTGTAQRDEKGNLSVLGTSVFVRSDEQ